MKPLIGCTTKSSKLFKAHSYINYFCLDIITNSLVNLEQIRKCDKIFSQFCELKLGDGFLHCQNSSEHIVFPVGVSLSFTAQKLKFSIKDFFSKCDQIGSFQRIWSHLLKKSLMENFIFCTVFINPFLDNAPILYWLKTPENLWVLNFSGGIKWEHWPGRS